MAGRARWHALNAELLRRAAETFEPSDTDPKPTTLDWVCEWLESGQTLKELAVDLTKTLSFDVTYASLMRYLRDVFGDDATEQRLDASRLRASHSMAETALELVDAQAYSNIDVARAASRARTRQWMAERYNPQRFGQSKGVNVAISLGVLHLDALRAHSQVVTGALQQGEIGVQRVIPTQETSS